MPSPRKLFANTLCYFRRAMGSKVVRHCGVNLPTDPELLPAELIDLIYRGRYERQEAKLARAELSKDDRVLELGGGIGFMGTLCAQICGSDNVMTFEANQDLEDIILHTHALNNVGPTLRMQPVAATAGPMVFYKNENIVSSSLVDRDFGGETSVEAVAFEDVVKAFRPTAIVCDIEGAEISVFSQADLMGVEKILIELHPKIVGEDVNSLLAETFIQRGFALVEGSAAKVAFFKRNTG